MIELVKGADGVYSERPTSALVRSRFAGPPIGRGPIPRQPLLLGAGTISTPPPRPNLGKSIFNNRAFQKVSSARAAKIAAGGGAGRMALKVARGGILFDLAYAAIDIPGQAFVGAARWASQSGREEDYLGGFAYGATKAFGANAGGTLGAAAGAGIGTLIFPAIGTTIGGIIGGAGGYIAGEAGINNAAIAIGRTASAFASTGVSLRKVQFGGDFRDSQQAYTMRQVAVQEMAGSLMNARQYLGNESYFFHR